MILLFQKMSYSQGNVDQLLELGIENTERFATDYFAPAGELLVNSLSNGWYSSAEVKEAWHFNIGIVGNISFIREEKQSFILRTAEYDGVAFVEGPPSQTVSSALGGTQVGVAVELNQGQLAQLDVQLPGGIGDQALNIAPTGFIQASAGISKSTEFKLRFLPKISVREDTEVFLFGTAIQHEFSDWIFSWKRLPFRVSGLIGYTHIRGFYDFSEDSSIDGDDQEIELISDAWLVTGIISTKFPKLNFYGGFGFYAGNSTADVIGTYRVQNGPLAAQILTDPISVENATSGLKATIGATIKYGYFRGNLDYSLQNYENISIGLRFEL